MDKIIFGSYMFRYPLGGMLSWALQYLLGLKDLGCDVYFVEKASYENACYDPVKGKLGNDCIYGIKVVSELLRQFGLENKWCFVDSNGSYFGLSKRQVDEIFRNSCLFIDSGAHGSWAEESLTCKRRVLIDGEPAYTQMKWMNGLENGISIPAYDRYFTNGKNIDTNLSSAPTLKIKWGHIYSPVKTSLFNNIITDKRAPYSTIMNWQSHNLISYRGKDYGQKDIEFEKFITLPGIVNWPLEVAVSGKNVPFSTLQVNRWIVKDAREVTMSFDTFQNYLTYCRGEFSVCKNVFVENHTGWFSDKSAAYLASSRPVILQDTGFSNHLPTGIGLFAIKTVEEAAQAMQEIEGNYKKHSDAAREIAVEHLEAKKVMKDFLDEVLS